MSKLLFNVHPLVIDKELATLIGLNETIILQQIHYWIEINRKASVNFYEEKYWTYNTIAEWREHFPFWSFDTVKRTLTRLRKLGLIITGNFNKLSMDRTLWYSIDYEKLNKLAEKPKEQSEEKPNKTAANVENSQKCILPQCKRADCTNALGQNAPMHWGKMPQAIPEITTEINSINTIYLSPKKELGIERETENTKREFDDILKNSCYDQFPEKDAIEQALRLLYFSDKPLKINDMKVPPNQVREDIKKVNWSTLEFALRDFKIQSEKQEIRYPVGYLSRCIYNAIFQGRLKMDAELRYSGFL